MIKMAAYHILDPRNRVDLRAAYQVETRCYFHLVLLSSRLLESTIAIVINFCILWLHSFYFWLNFVIITLSRRLLLFEKPTHFEKSGRRLIWSMCALAAQKVIGVWKTVFELTQLGMKRLKSVLFLAIIWVYQLFEVWFMGRTANKLNLVVIVAFVSWSLQSCHFGEGQVQNILKFPIIINLWSRCLRICLYLCALVASQVRLRKVEHDLGRIKVQLAWLLEELIELSSVAAKFLVYRHVVIWVERKELCTLFLSLMKAEVTGWKLAENLDIWSCNLLSIGLNKVSLWRTRALFTISFTLVPRAHIPYWAFDIIFKTI